MAVRSSKAEELGSRGGEDVGVARQTAMRSTILTRWTPIEGSLHREVETIAPLEGDIGDEVMRRRRGEISDLGLR
ncbi:unnamed protein product [Arabis nemorensis]|uniref:Uncharacterized protein n=1 Tax=Arabis nemorensis TaxID=586526 RepID=A0A565AZA1_9BRAS|nr:unnamed protein product [Arabis nemorensis]